ncbi:MAG: S8 family serine peptidase, partial [Gemmatimonadales bacterium]|nr:S8 family serine peptidase [Gemmatimonadales bacterium]
APPAPPDFPNFPPPFTPGGDFVSRVFVRLDVPSEGVQGVLDGRLWADNGVEFVRFQSTPYRWARFYEPKSHRLRLEHPRYKLPASASVSAYDRDVLAYIKLDPAAVAPPAFAIRAKSHYFDLKELAEFGSPFPAAAAEWSSSDPAILKSEGPGRFRAVGAGEAVVRVRSGNAETKLPVLVRSNPSQPVLHPTGPADVVVDPVSKTRVVRDQVVVVFRDGIPEADRRALIERYGMVRLGTVETLGLHQLQYDPRQWALKALVDTLTAEPAVERAAPNCAGGPFVPVAIDPFVPGIVSLAARQLAYTNLFKTEAFAGFGVLRQLLPPMNPQTVTFIDTGLFVDPVTGNFDPHFATRVVLRHCAAFGSSKTPLVFNGANAPALKAALSAPRRPGTNDRHGNVVAGVAAATWSPPPRGSLGVNEQMGVAMLQFGTANDAVIAAMIDHAASLQGDELRVVNMSIGFENVGAKFPETSAWWTNWTLEEAMKRLIQRDRLVVIAAGNHSQSVKEVGLASIKGGLSADEGKNIITVACTALDIPNPATAHPEDNESRWADGAEGSAYAPAGTPSLIDLAGPGSVVACTNGDGEIPISGTTSVAAPFVSGLAALLFGILPKGIRASVVKEILVDTGDQIHYDPIPPTPRRRLFSEPDKHIGPRRVNVWKAILNAANRTVPPGIRFVGLRITADTAGLVLRLEKGPGVLPETLNDSSVRNEPETTKATRITLTNQRGALFPLALTAWQGSPLKKVCELDLQPLLALPAIDALSPRFVHTIQLFTSGKVTVVHDDREKPLAGRARLVLSNRGTKPTDIDFLDPVGRHPGDKSIKPWMQLSKGDSYALVHELLSGPADTRIAYFDGTGQPLPAHQVDDRGRPYVTVPFGESGTVLVSASTPVRVRITAVSLNNEVVKDAVELSLGPAPVPVPHLVAPGWLIRPDAPLELRNTTATRYTLKLAPTSSPSSWKAVAEMVGVYVPPVLEPFGKVAVTGALSSPAGAAVGSGGSCTIRVTSDPPGIDRTLRFEGRLGQVKTSLSPLTAETQHVSHFPGKEAVYSRFHLTLANLSEFPIWFEGVESTEALFPGALPPPGTPKERLPSGYEFEEFRILPGEDLTFRLEVYYHAKVLKYPPGTIGVRTAKLLIAQPHERVGVTYPTNPVTLRTILVPAPPT